MIKSLIIDDEKPFINSLRSILKTEKDIQIIGEARSVEEGISMINETEPDLIFLDIQMSDGTGFDLLKKANRRDFHVIFITAHDQHAIEAFRFSAIDYLLKPLLSQHLYAALEKVREKTEASKINLQLSVLLDNMETMSRSNKKIILRESETLHILKLDEILYCEADGSYTNFFLTEKRKIVVSQHLKEFEDYLSPSGFFRGHRSYLINVSKILRFDRLDRGTVLIEGGNKLSISLRKKDKLLQVLNSLRI